jgi:hypothetical protein
MQADKALIFATDLWVKIQASKNPKLKNRETGARQDLRVNPAKNLIVT